VGLLIFKYQWQNISVSVTSISAVADALYFSTGNAPAHTAHKTMELLTRETPDYYLVSQQSSAR